MLGIILLELGDYISYFFIVDLRHLETFVKIAELKSFTKAAEVLYLTQPTVSKQIVDLENFFNIKLVDRTKRNVSLTKAGEILLQYSKSLISLKKEAIEALEAFKGLKQGNITVGASSIPGVYILPKVLNEFKKRYTGIQVKLIVSDSEDIIRRTELGEVDIGFVGAKNAGDKIEYKRFFDDVIVIIGSTDCPDSIKTDDLSKYPVINRESGSGTRNNFEAALKKINIVAERDLNIVAELTDNEAIKEAVKYGMGISYISKMAVNNELCTGSLKKVRIEGLKELKRPFFIITRRGKTILPQIIALIETAGVWKKNIIRVK